MRIMTNSVYSSGFARKNEENKRTSLIKEIYVMREKYKSISYHIRAIISEDMKLRQRQDDDHDDHEICVRL